MGIGYVNGFLIFKKMFSFVIVKEMGSKINWSVIFFLFDW